jgi:microcin C transport system permease protein
VFSDPLSQRRWRNFKANKRGYVSAVLLIVLVLLSLVAELIANDKPLLVKYQGNLYVPVFNTYLETDFNGDFATEADFRDPYVQDLIRNNGEKTLAEGEKAGWILWPLISFSYDTINYSVSQAPSPPDWTNLLGTDEQARDVLARVIYGFRVSILFGLAVTVMSTLIGVLAGALQGFFGGRIDLFFQRVVEIWASTPTLYLIMIIAAVIEPTFLILTLLIGLFSWTGLVGVVRAEFLRARNFEYVQAARALGVSNSSIMFRHLLPNAMVATLTMLPFLMTGAIGGLAALDFLGFGLPASYPSLGELTLQGKNNLQAPWLGITAFFTFAIMLSLLVFVFEALRDAFDPRKVFA